MNLNRMGFLLVTIISVFVLFFNLGGIPLLDPDEPVYAQTPKEMIANNDYISPRIYGEYWYDKPPLYYWLVAGAFHLFGVGEFAARFPSALLGVLTALYVCRVVGRILNPRTGVLSALILVTCVEFFYLGKAAVTDITLNFCLTVALLSFWQKKYYLFYAFAGMAVLAKGPVGFLFPGAILFIYFVVNGQWRRLTEMRILQGIFVFGMVAVPWYFVMYQIHGMAFIDTFIGFHNITRFTSPEHPGRAQWHYFVPVLIVGFFPWVAVMVQAVWNSFTRSGRAREFLIFLNIWAWFIFVFFTFSKTKLVSYILPMFVPLSIITGWYINGLIEKCSSIARRSWSIVLLILSVLLSGLLFASIEVLQNSEQNLITGIYAAMIIITLMGIIAGYLLWKSRITKAFAVQVLGMSLFVVVLMGVLLPAASPILAVKETSQELKKYYDGASPLYIVKFLRPGVAFYADLYGTEIESNWGKNLPLEDAIKTEGKAYYVIRQSHYERIKKDDKHNLIILSSNGDRMLLMKNK